MKHFFKSHIKNNKLIKFFDIEAFCKSKNLSVKDVGTIKDNYVKTSAFFTVFLSAIILSAMVFYLFYGFITKFFFNGEQYGIVKFVSVVFMFVLSSITITIYFLTRNKNLRRVTKETLIFTFELFVLVGVFLFFISDCMDPLTSTSFSAGFLWLVILGIIPCLPIAYWALLSLVSLGGTITSLIIFGSKQPYPFQYYLIVLLVIFGTLIIRSLEFQSAYYRFAEKKSGDENFVISKTDVLTGIENRRGLESFINNKFPSWKLRGDYITLAMFDVDFFKEYNDSFGHVAGDQCLKDLVKAVNSAFPNKSLDFFRFGGDEFIIVFQEPDLNMVDKFCQKIIDGVQERKIIASPDANEKYLSVSLGAKTVKVDIYYTLFEHIEFADKMLYQVKNNGKGYGIVNDHEIGDQKFIKEKKEKAKKPVSKAP